MPSLPQGLSHMEVPSPIQEESGTPNSRGTGTTSSSSNRRQETPVGDDMSRFSPMGAAVRHSQISGLTPVQESSFEAISGSHPDRPPSMEASNTFIHPPTLSPHVSPHFRYNLNTAGLVSLIGPSSTRTASIMHKGWRLYVHLLHLSHSLRTCRMSTQC